MTIFGEWLAAVLPRIGLFFVYAIVMTYVGLLVMGALIFAVEAFERRIGREP